MFGMVVALFSMSEQLPSSTPKLWEVTLSSSLRERMVMMKCFGWFWAMRGSPKLIIGSGDAFHLTLSHTSGKLTLAKATFP